MRDQEPGNSALIGLIYLLVAVGCAVTSAWSVFHGLAIMPWQLAGLFAAIIFLALFMCHYVVLRRRQNGAALLQAPHGLVGPLFLLLFVTVASASSSFAFFYNLFLRDNLAVSRAQEAGQTFENNASRAEDELRKLDRNAQIRYEIEQLMGQLKVEVTEANRDGFGDQAKPLVDKIAMLMREQVRRPIVLPTFPPLGSTKEEFTSAYDKLESQIDDNLKAWDEASPIKQGLNKLKKIRAESDKSVKEARSSDLGALEKKRDAIDDLAGKTAEMERAVNSAIDAANLPKPPEPLKLVARDAKGIGLTNVVEVWGAVSKGEGVGIAAGSIFLAVLLDLLPFLMAMVFLKPGTAHSPRNRGSRGEGGRRAKQSRDGDIAVRGSKRWE